MNLKNCLANKFSKSTIVIRFNLLPVYLSIPPFAFVLLFISSFYVLSSYCLVIVSLSLVVVSNFGGGGFEFREIS